MFKVRRQARYDKLKEAHFLSFEARELSRIPFSHAPYIRGMGKERMGAFEDAIREYRERKLRFSRVEWRRIIVEMYITRNWLDKEGKPDFWQMLRANAEKWKARDEKYDSPPQPRRIKVKRKSEFVSKRAEGLEAYEKGRYR